jgi:hypothetical protein
LKDCKQLTRLYLRIPKINDTFFKDIHLYLPQLKYLNLRGFQITDNALSSISKLKKMNKITVEEEFGQISCITDTSLHYFINNCPQIKSIHFSNKTNITNKTVEELIALAERNLAFNTNIAFQNMINSKLIICQII